MTDSINASTEESTEEKPLIDLQFADGLDAVVVKGWKFEIKRARQVLPSHETSDGLMILILKDKPATPHRSTVEEIMFDLFGRNTYVIWE